MADVPRMFYDHNSFLACSDSRIVWRVLKCLVPTNWRKSTINRRCVISYPVIELDSHKLSQAAHIVERTRLNPGFYSFVDALLGVSNFRCH